MKRNHTLLLIAWFALLPCAQAETLFIDDATIHTQQSQGILQNADLLLRDGIVQAIGSDLEAPSDATVIEAAGRPLTPGFFAGITQLGLVEIEAVESTVDQALSDLAMRPEFDVAPAYNPFSTAIPVTRIEGLTWTVLGAVRSGSIIAGQGRPVLLDGGYESFIGDSLLFIDVGGDASGQSGGSRAAQWMLLDQAMAEAQSEIQWSPATLLTPTGRTVLSGYRDGGLVVFDADRASDILQVLEFCTRHGLNPVITGGAEAWMVADRLAESGVPVLIDALDNLPADFDSLGARLDNAAILHEAGVTLAFTGVETPHARKLRQLAGNAVANGLPYEAGLAAMTVNPARIFGLEDNYGTISEGSRADLVLWSGDPLEVTTAADQVIIGGRLIDMVSRQTLLRDRYLEANPDLPRAYIKP
jgi:imidazolonepropionase-like amidohydrolase